MKKFNKEELLLNFIKEHLEKYGYPPTVREMCRAVKVSSTSTISYYLTKLEQNGLIKKSPNKNRALEVVSKEENLSSINNVINIEEYRMQNDFVKIPIVGKITAGEPILAVENVEEYFMVTPNLFRGEGLFMLSVSGDSMINAGIFDGDKIILRQQNYANNGDIVAALIDGSATVKRFFKEQNKIRLQPENDSMAPIIVDHAEILGKVIGLVRKF